MFHIDRDPKYLSTDDAKMAAEWQDQPTRICCMSVHLFFFSVSTNVAVRFIILNETLC